MAQISPVHTALTGLTALVKRPSLIVAWTLMQLPYAALPAIILWALPRLVEGSRPNPNTLLIFALGMIVFALGLSAWMVMMRGVVIRAVLDPSPGSAIALRWGTAESSMMMMRFSRSGPAPWLETFLVIAVIFGSMFVVTEYAPRAWPLEVIIIFAAIIWLRVRSSLTLPLIVDRKTQNWLDARREGWTLTGRHFAPLAVMETLTVTIWLILSSLIGFAIVTALGLAAFANAGLTTFENAASNHQIPDMLADRGAVVALVALGLWLALVNALHMIICTIPTVNAYMALRPEADADIKAA
jgi:hypothetical protein